MWLVVINEVYGLDGLRASVVKVRTGTDLMAQLKPYKNIANVWPFDTQKKAREIAERFNKNK